MPHTCTSVTLEVYVFHLLSVRRLPALRLFTFLYRGTICSIRRHEGELIKGFFLLAISAVWKGTNVHTLKATKISIAKIPSGFLVQNTFPHFQFRNHLVVTQLTEHLICSSWTIF